MTQEAIALRTSGGAYPGLEVVQDVNKALDTIATDFAGASDPAALAGPYMTWADTGNMLLKRRNAAGTAWVVQHAIDPIANQLEVDTGTNDDKFVTPKKLRWGVSWVLGANGYFALPSWMGGFIIQWGSGNTGAGGSIAVTFPITFTAVWAISTGYPSGGFPATNMLSYTSPTVTGMNVGSTISTTGAMALDIAFNWIAIGH